MEHLKALSLLALLAGQAFGATLLGGDPLSVSEPAFEPVDHPQPPNGLWGSYQGPYFTNIWWGNLILEDGTGVIVSYPYELEAHDDGVHISLPEIVSV